MSLPAALKHLRHALRETLPTAGREAHRRTRLAQHTLERAREAEAAATEATLTPNEFRKRYGYLPTDAPRMRTAAELATYLQR